MRPIHHAITRALSVAALAATLPAAANAAVIRVNVNAAPGGDGASWASALNSLQTALALAQPGDEIRVAQGTYRPGPPGSPRNTSFNLRDGVRLKGGYLAIDTAQDIRNIASFPTILSGDLNGDDGPNFTNRADNSYHVLYALNFFDPATLLEGFTIRGGYANGPAVPPDDIGGGLLANTFQGTIRECVFTDNAAHYGGGAFIVHAGSEAKPFRVERSMFIGNHHWPSSAGGYAAGLSIGNSRAEVVSCAFTGNTSTLHGGGLGLASHLAETRVTDVVNCTFVGNTAAGGGGGVFISGPEARVRNCIAWGNSGAWSAEGIQILDIGGRSSVANSCVQDLNMFAGAGNMADHPMLVDPDGADNVIGTLDDNVRPLDASPVVNAGDAFDLPSGSTRDLAGNARIWFGQVDMGAYESGSVVPSCHGDFNGDGAVDSADLAITLGSWGSYSPPLAAVADIDADNDVDAADLAMLLGLWGVCP